MRFGDGRSQRVESLSGDGVDARITISPFLRRGSSDDTLWLGVMPLPSEGPITLSVTWRSKGIEEAAVQWPGGAVRPHQANVVLVEVSSPALPCRTR